MTVNVLVGCVILGQLIYFSKNKHTMNVRDIINTMVNAFILVLVLHYGTIAIVHYMIEDAKTEIIHEIQINK